MTASAASCGAATASSRQMPTEAMPPAAALADGPGIGAGAMRNATHPGTALGPWLATTRRRTAQPEPAACHKNVVEPSSWRNRLGASDGSLRQNSAQQPYL